MQYCKPIYRALQACSSITLLAGSLVLTLLVLAGCNAKHQTGSELPPDSHELRKVGQYSLPSELVGVASLQFFKESGHDYLSVLDVAHFEILVYNLDSKELIKRVSLPDIGRTSILTHNMINLDSILICSFFNDPAIFTLDTSGHIIRKRPIVTGKKFDRLTFPFSESEYQVQVVGRDLYIPLRPINDSIGIFTGSYSRYSSYLLLRENGEQQFLYHLPKVYNKKFWGLIYWKYLASICFNPEDPEERYLGFSVNPLVQKYRTDHLLKEGVITSRFINEAKPFYENVKTYRKRIKDEEKGNSKKLTYADLEEWAASNSDYGTIIYEPSSKLFLRSVFIRPDLKQCREGRTRAERSYIIFNSELQVLGETKMPTSNSAGLTFINNDGIHVLNSSTKELTFDLYKVVKKEE